MSQKGYSSFYRAPAKGNPGAEHARIPFLNLTDDSIGESQNFQLMVSQSSSIEEFTNSVKSSALKNDDNEDIIILSDSSYTASPKSLRKSVKKEATNNDKILISDSSISAISSSEDETFFQNWRTNQNIKIQAKLRENNKSNALRGSKVWITSDETSSSASGNEGKLCFKSTSDSSCTHVSPTQKSIDDTRNMIKTFTKLGNGHLGNTKLSSSDSINSEPSKQFNTPTRSMGQSTRQINSSSRKLTKRELSGILKTIKSTRAVYESPRQLQKDCVIIDETLDEDMHPAISPTNKFRNRPMIINETPPNNKNDVINIPKGDQTHTENQSVQPDLLEQTGLSSRKTKQIAEWLMTNSPDSKSDSSISYVPPTNRNSINSGNSSLERLELNYETPNNRGKIQKPSDKEKKQTGSKKKNTVGLLTKNDNLINKVDKNVNRNLTMVDKLQGSTWKTRINTAHPVSEPRINHHVAKDRGIQTERKKTNKEKKNWIMDSHEDDSDSSLNDIRPEINSKSKTVKRTKKKNDSFINDNCSSTESDEDSLYYTALTNPRTSRNSTAKPTPQSVLVKRALALCDSESDEDKPKEKAVHATDLGRRRLEYSDDEDDIKSSTSEFDPGDHVPPKPAAKKETKTPRTTFKAKPQNKILSSIKPLGSSTKSNQSFLASLSETVPLTHAHPDAKKYRANFKNTKDDLSKCLFKLYNEKVFDNQLPHDMSMEWNVRMRGTAGYCYNKKSVKTLGGIVRSSRIVLATKILDTPDRLRDTLIHEMCHAAAWLINEVSDGHGPFWTAWASKAMKIFPELPPIRRCHDYEIKTKFTYKCTSCGYSIGRHSKSLDVERKRCGHCYGKFELLVNKTTKSGTVQVQTPKREPSAFALFVKENYHSVKKECNVKHAEIMKILSAQFSAVKIAKKNDEDKEN